MVTDNVTRVAMATDNVMPVAMVTDNVTHDFMVTDNVTRVAMVTNVEIIIIIETIAIDDVRGDVIEELWAWNDGVTDRPTKRLL